MKPVYERFIENPDFTKPEFVELIKCAEDPEAVRRLKEEAVRIREIYYGKKVFTRGLIEYTNYCKNDCYYCGIRKSNANAKRYRLTEDEIMAGIRELVSMLPANNEDDMSYEDCTDDLNRACADLENAKEDTALALTMISDDNIFFEVKKAYAKDMVTGFIKLNGMTVGAVANRSKVYNEEAEVEAEFDGSLSADGAEKAAEFVEFCDAFNVPVLTLTNVSGFTASEYDEKRIAKSAAKLTYAFADATVPKVNVVIGKAFGSAYVTMNSKATGADMVYAWPTAEIGMMDANQAAKIMYADADAATIREKAAEYKNLQSSPLSAAKRGYVDTIIEAADTRKYVIGAFEMLFTKREDRPVKKHGTV